MNDFLIGETYTISENELHEVSMLIHRLQFIADCTSQQDRVNTSTEAIAATVDGIKSTLKTIQDGIIHRHQMRHMGA